MDNFNYGKSSSHKYVSIFRIDGSPILPPLMTTEKRRQMQKIKENALKIEKLLKERKLVHGERDSCTKDTKLENEFSKLYTSDNISQQSQDYYDSKLKETQESIALLKSLIQNPIAGVQEKPIDILGNACNLSYRDENQEKFQKLQKSEILIYDNSTNQVIQLPAEKKVISYDQDLNNVSNKKSSQLLLAGVNNKGMTVTPSICLNPPTPSTANKNLCEDLGSVQNSDLLIKFENHNNQKSDFNKDFRSDDDSFTSVIIQERQKNTHQCSKHPTTANGSKNVQEKCYASIENVSAKIQQFEAISSDTNTPQTSPESVYKNRKTCFGTPTGTMGRSATSPSIKVATINRSSSSRSQGLAQDSDSPENSLVRSSSFTLEGPSKALIEHMQQQHVISYSKPVVKSPLNITQNSSRKSLSSPSRAHRDTVESKAKKVQKVELQSSKQKIQQKASKNKLAQAAVASITPNFTSSLTRQTNTLRKIKQLPCDISNISPTSVQTLQKTSRHVRKSYCKSPNLAQNKTSTSKLTSPSKSTSISSNIASTPQTGKEKLNKMDKMQKDKFLQLLAQQEEEHRRLQQSFEMQQKVLIEELNREMIESHLKSPSNSKHSYSFTPTLRHKRIDKQQPLSPRQLTEINSTGFASDHDTKNRAPESFELTRLVPQSNQREQSSSISTNSSYNSFDKNSSKTLNSHQYSSYASQFAQSSHSISLTKSLMDHSNANTSLDISTLSSQTSPDALRATPTTQNNTLHNTAGTKTPPSSRRRLFATEINVDRNHMNSRSVRSPYTTTQCLVDQEKQLNRANDMNRRAQAGNSLIFHAAATKINAYARGFLVRRLFQTEQIQRIVQTIRDTLIFVLNLHMETIEVPEESQTPANIKLKARLLQQLSSACRTLHFVFFQTSIEERMEIIARDRTRIKTKLILMINKR